MSGDFWRRLRLPWLTRRDIEAEIDEELGFHIEMRARELIDAGVDEEAARTRAAEDFGDVGATRAGYTARRARQLGRTRGRMALSGLVQDLRFGARALRRHPSFAGAAVVVLAVGIGAPATVFTLVDTIFFDRPAHVVDPHRLIRLYRSWAPGQGGGALGHPDYLYYRENASTLGGLAAYGGRAQAAYTMRDGEPDQLALLHTSHDFFDVLGVSPALGRTFTPEENTTPGTHPVAILAHGFWTRATGSDRAAVGATLTLNGLAFTVVGVAPEGFRGISPAEPAPDVWVPIAMFGPLRRASDTAWWERRPDSQERWLNVVGRVADGVTIEAAEANLVALGAALAYEGKDPEEGVLVTRQFLYAPSVQASITSLSRMLLAVVAIVLLIAASNVAVLLLSRATTRTREMGIRTALGAGRARLVRQLLAEGLLLGVLGGGLGLALAFASADFAARLLPLPLETTVSPRGWVLAAAAALALVTSLVVGLAPALQVARTDVRATLHGESARSPGGRLRGALVVSQVALSVVLLAGALLFARSFWAARGEDLGFDAGETLIVGVDLQSLGYDADEGRAFVTEALGQVAALPGVSTVATSRQVPFGGDWSTDIDAPPGGTPNAADGGITVGLNAVTDDYFGLVGVQILAGRAFGPGDRQGAAAVTVINEALAELLWPGEDPIGRVLEAGESGFLVVGLARDATYYELGEEPKTQAYVHELQIYMSLVHFLVKTEADAAALAPVVQAELRRLDPTLAFGRVTTMASVVEEAIARYKVSAVLVGLFGAIALLLATAGLYGTVSYLVSRRTREIGVRMALGADRGRVARQVFQAGLRLAALGTVLGLAGAVAFRGLTESLLFGVEPADPIPLAGACVALFAVTALASLGPARRATRIDPIDAIRSD